MSEKTIIFKFGHYAKSTNSVHCPWCCKICTDAMEGTPKLKVGATFYCKCGGPFQIFEVKSHGGDILVRTVPI